MQVPGRLTASPGYLALAEVVGRHAPPAALDLLRSYFAVGEPDLLADLFQRAGLRIDRLDTWLGAIRLESIETFVSVELLPIADQITPAVRDGIVAECRDALARFVDPAGAIAAPIEVQLVAARKPSRGCSPCGTCDEAARPGTAGARCRRLTLRWSGHTDAMDLTYT